MFEGFFREFFLIGSMLAVVISYGINKSILWATIHGFFGWFYVIYNAIWG